VQLSEKTFAARIDRLAAMGLLDDAKRIAAADRAGLLIFDAERDAAKTLRTKLKPPKRRASLAIVQENDVAACAAVCEQCPSKHFRGFINAADGSRGFVKCTARPRCCGGGYMDQSLRTGSCKHWPKPADSSAALSIASSSRTRGGNSKAVEIVEGVTP
jgi:hypothetical protein